MNCIVTAGPTYEPMDKVRRLTNFSTGRLGAELANFLVSRGHEVTLLMGHQATYGGELRAQRVERFGTTSDLRERMQAKSSADVQAIFHAAAVSDFAFGRLLQRSPQGELTEIKAGKLSTRQGTVLAELIPTPKIISRLRDWFPRARIAGWKYEVDGDRAAAIAAASKQIRECLTDVCVANGPAYGLGFGVVTADGKCYHTRELPALCELLEQMVS